MKVINTINRYLLSRSKTSLFLLWFLLSSLIVFTNYLTETAIQFPVLFILPVCLAAWYNGMRWGILLAVLLPLARIGLLFIKPVPWDFSISVINALIRIIPFVCFAFLVSYIAKQKAELEKEVKILEGMLSVCSFCKKIRDEQDNWQPMESYITAHSEAMFSHSFCPECYEKNYGEFLRQVKKQ